ncbi:MULTISPECIES: hypothetical protein [unclassified Streptomyces]|uniref:hypothetical protein n=1 Tax=unclassified Streptomyces TaxID=2593676 RepID=UPI001CBF5320|nr:MULTISPECIES: hypothetical protein [unclassified Streptomyces]WPO70859.1 hypothetical protein R9806_09580 [Streptomyces sp. KN37]
MHEARAAYAHAYRVKYLGEQADAWYQAKRLTEYVTAVRNIKEGASTRPHPTHRHRRE